MIYLFNYVRNKGWIASLGGKVMRSLWFPGKSQKISGGLRKKVLEAILNHLFLPRSFLKKYFDMYKKLRFHSLWLTF